MKKNMPYLPRVLFAVFFLLDITLRCSYISAAYKVKQTLNLKGGIWYEGYQMFCSGPVFCAHCDR